MVKNPPANAGDTKDSGSIPELGRYLGRRNGNPLQYSCLENPMDRGAWWAAVHRVAKSRTRLERLIMHACIRGQYLSFVTHNRDYSSSGCLEPEVTATKWVGGMLVWGKEKPPGDKINQQVHEGCRQSLVAGSVGPLHLRVSRKKTVMPTFSAKG